MLLIILVIISVVGVAWTFAFYNEILTFITNLSDRTRIFIFENKTLIDMTFLITYSILQLIFILQISKPHANINLIVTLFVLSLLTLLGIERLCLKSRFNFLYDQMSELNTIYSINESDYQRALKREKELIERFKNLKISYNKLKGDLLRKKI